MTFIDPSDSHGMSDRLFPARLTGVYADEDGIFLYSWVEMEITAENTLVEAAAGRFGVLDRESAAWQYPDGSNIAFYRAVEPSDGAAVELSNMLVPISSLDTEDGNEEFNPIVWLRLRGSQGKGYLRYEFQWNPAARMVLCSSSKYADETSGLPNQYNPGYYEGLVQYLNPETGDWLSALPSVLIKPADARSVVQVGLRHLAVPVGYVTTEEDGEPGKAVWSATGNASELVEFGYWVPPNTYSGSFRVGRVVATGESCWINSVGNDLRVGSHVGVAAGTYQDADDYPKPVYVVAQWGGITIDGTVTLNLDVDTTALGGGPLFGYPHLTTERNGAILTLGLQPHIGWDGSIVIPAVGTLTVWNGVITDFTP